MEREGDTNPIYVPVTDPTFCDMPMSASGILLTLRCSPASRVAPECQRSDTSRPRLTAAKAGLVTWDIHQCFVMVCQE